eukprot:Opistho-2@27978
MRAILRLCAPGILGLRTCGTVPPLSRCMSTATAVHPANDTAPARAARSDAVRNNWTREEIKAIYDSPLLDLMHNAGVVHRRHFNAREVQQCTLLSIKTGGCSEDCSYCPQSSKYKTEVKAQNLMNVDEVIEAARKARDAGSTRFCMGAAWRDVVHRKSNFKSVIGMVKEVRSMGMEVCCTLGMLDADQARQLKEAGLTAYNHNLDTSREFYPKIITTRSYDERLQTLENVRNAGINVCSGGIIGLGEAESDRIGLLHTLATLPAHPESVPVNALVPVQGTPLAAQEKVNIWEMLRMIATARIVMPTTMVRLSAGRVNFSMAEQALCFMSGANSIFTGDKLLTTKNNAFTEDSEMFGILGLVGKEPSFEASSAAHVTTAHDAVGTETKSGGCGGGGCGKNGGCGGRATADSDPGVATAAAH